jgi:hypothetical protein
MRAARYLLILLISALWVADPGGQRRADDPPFLRRAEIGRRMPGAPVTGTVAPTVLEEQRNREQGNGPRHAPRERRMQRAGSFDGDLRSIPDKPVRRRERPERHGPRPEPMQLAAPTEAAPSGDLPITASAAAPATSANFDGLDFATWGAGHPPDTNGDVGPAHFIQSINSSLGIYDKATGTRIAAFTLDAFMSQGNFGNLCDTDNFGDPVILYDTFEDRWVITDFAFTINNVTGDVINPPGAFECFAVSKTADPVAGGWNFYSINTPGGLGDYPKLGVWPDGLYMSLNMFDYAASGSFQNVRLFALNKAQMYAGAPAVQIVEFDLPASEFSLLPSNARLQTGTPPTGTPNLFTSVWNYLNAVSVWKFHVDWNNLGASTLTGPFNSITSSSWSVLTANTVESPGNRLDTLFPRLMMQNQYSNIGGVESLWNSHTVGASGNQSAQSAVRYYEVRVTGGAIESSASQAATYSPDAVNRFMPSVAVDRAGNMAIGYSATSPSLFPAIRYAGRLASDPINTISQTETTMIAGTGTQSGPCGPGSCERWGDYSTMTLDPDGCTFWYTNEYYQVTGLNHRTRIGAFAYPSCTPNGFGAIQGAVRNTSMQPIAGATVTLGSRTTTTDGFGNYSFIDLPAGTYPVVSASAAGYTPTSFNSIVVSSGSTTTRDFTLPVAVAGGCMTDTTQADFQAGMSVNCDLTGTPGSVKLLSGSAADQQNLNVTPNGFGFHTTNWSGQTFTPAVTGALTRVDLDLFCAGCTGTTPDITVSIRATTGATPVPTGGDLAVATIPGFGSGAGGFFSAVFAAPVTLTAGTRYAIVIRPVANPSAGTYAYVCSCSGPPFNSGTNPYASGQRIISSNSGGTWSADTVAGGRDLGFVTFMHTGFAPSGTFESSVKDANPAPGSTAAWGNLTWTVTTPPGTSVQFQAAASNNPNGPFNFVGPDGTAATFFTNGAPLAQFNGNRYLKYRANLTTSNNSVTPSIEEVTVCFNNSVSSQPSATLAPGAVTFSGKTLVGRVSPPSPPVTLTNNGPGMLTFATFNGAPPTSTFMVGSDFPANTDCPLSGLPWGASCQFIFGFAPAAAGPRNATLTIVTNASNSPHTVSLSGTGFVVDDATVTATVVSGATRLQQLQNPDGGWYFLESDTSCFGSSASCPNIIGNTALALLSAYDRNGDPAVLADAVAAGELLESMYNANPARRPFTQDLEFLVALSDAAQDPQYSTLATTWFGNITAQFPNPADRVDATFTGRNNQGLRSLAVWDTASIIRMAKAAGNVSYASGLAQRVIDREVDWKDVDVAHRWDQCGNPAGCGPAGNERAFDYTLLGMGSMLWAIHDLSGFDTTIDSYRAWLLSQQDAAGTWDVGDLQITAYAGLGLGAVGGPGTSDAILSAVAFYIERQLANGGWPFSYVNGVAGSEFTMVDSEVIRAIDILFSTQSGEAVHVTPAQLATVSFSSVTQSGSTTVVARQASGVLPWGYILVEGLTYEVQTSATVSGASTVCFSNALTTGLTDVRILHKEGDRFVDRSAILSGQASGGNCARADSLNTFAIARKDPNAVDTESPALSVTVSPTVLSPPNNRMVTITAAISASDNTGVAPSIALVSIDVSGSDRGKKEAVEGAALGSDDRVFQLRAQKGRVYTVVYRATDASGNATLVSKQISVP